jgi:hypothetical protein
LSLSNFKIIEAMGLKLLHRGPLEWHYILTKFHENIPSCSKVLSGGHRQTGDLIKLLSFSESKLKMKFGALSDREHTYLEFNFMAARNSSEAHPSQVYIARTLSFMKYFFQY